MSEWISVKDRLPKCEGEHNESDYVLVFIDNIDITSAWYEGNTEEWKNSVYNSDDNGLIGVSHWMPLPEPPKDIA